jgi:hypothetical protein
MAQALTTCCTATLWRRAEIFLYLLNCRAYLAGTVCDTSYTLVITSVTYRSCFNRIACNSHSDNGIGYQHLTAGLTISRCRPSSIAFSLNSAMI